MLMVIVRLWGASISSFYIFQIFYGNYILLYNGTATNLVKLFQQLCEAQEKPYSMFESKPLVLLLSFSTPCPRSDNHAAAVL